MVDKEQIKESFLEVWKEDKQGFIFELLRCSDIMNENKEYLQYLRSEYSKRLNELIDSGGKVRKTFDGLED